MKTLPYFIGALLLVICSFWIGRWSAPQNAPPEPEVITKIDTLRIPNPEAKDSIIVRTKYVTLPTIDTVFSHTSDTIIKLDSVQVAIPITQKEYSDTTYKAWVSGFDARLDSICVYPRTTIITTNARDRPKRWGLGVQLGAGYNGKDKFQPYIGIGVSYNILTW